MYRLWLNSTILLLAALFAVGCGGDSSGDAGSENDGGGSEAISQKGSDTMVPLAQKWSEEFNADHPEISVEVNGGGSGLGISSLINGQTVIANASRPMSDKERAQIRQKYGSDVVEIPVAKDAVAVYTHNDNPIKSLTIDQLRGIYTGQITNWSELGGSDAPIILYGRESSSGTYEFFKEHVLDGRDFAANTQTLSGTAAIVGAVAQDPNGIGYGGAAYTKEGVKQVPVGADAASALIADAANVADGTYALSRPLYFYLRQQPTGNTKTYIDWVLSEGQQVLLDSPLEYFPLNAATPAAATGADTSAATGDTSAEG